MILLIKIDTNIKQKVQWQDYTTIYSTASTLHQCTTIIPQSVQDWLASQHDLLYEAYFLFFGGIRGQHTTPHYSCSSNLNVDVFPFPVRTPYSRYSHTTTLSVCVYVSVCAYKYEWIDDAEINSWKFESMRLLPDTHSRSNIQYMYVYMDVYAYYYYYYIYVYVVWYRSFFGCSYKILEDDCMSGLPGTVYTRKWKESDFKFYLYLHSW